MEVVEELRNVGRSNETIMQDDEEVKDDNAKQEKLDCIHNTAIILENSNATPFKFKEHCYVCFYCEIICKDITKMRVHKNGHTKTELMKILNSYGDENFVVYVDVTDLKCMLCDEFVPNLNELTSHLKQVHGHKFRDFPDRVVPFKITPQKLQCQLCERSYKTFNRIEQHMNTHYARYSSEDSGNTSTEKSHKVGFNKNLEGIYKCEKCTKMYKTAAKLKNHLKVSHKTANRYRCMECKKHFSHNYLREKHMFEKHYMTPLVYTCNVCDESFDKKQLLSTHLKRIHLVKRFYCTECPYQCYSNNALKGHMVKHNGERIFPCTVCNKAYARKRTLREHMRIHNNDRRYACKECGLAFVQNCNLKSHIKTQHPSLMIE